MRRPENGSNFATWMETKIQRPRFSLYIRPPKLVDVADLQIQESDFIRIRVFTRTQQGVRRVTLRISGNSLLPRNNLARVGPEALRSRASHTVPAARYNVNNRYAVTISKSTEHERIIKCRAAYVAQSLHALRHGSVR